MTLHLIASCTGRKRAEVPQRLHLGAVRCGSKRGAVWLRRLAAERSGRTFARDLYCGEHWQLVLELESSLHAAGRDVDLTIASAGYGLVSAEARLKPYSATFTRGHTDSVPAVEACAWWTALCTGNPEAKTLKSLAAGDDTLVVIASAPYLRAMLPDLHLARNALLDPQQLIVFSGSQLPGFESSVVRVDDRVQLALRAEGSKKLRGTKQGLAARTALHLLTNVETWPPTADAMQTAYARLVSGQKRPEQIDRERHGDDDVRAFITTQLDEDPRVGWTKLLRAWRDSGHACEQKRFRGLFQDIKSQRE